MNNPRYITQDSFIGNAKIVFTGEQFTGLPILNTEVSIGEETLCCISWPQREEFIDKLNAIISEYRI